MCLRILRASWATASATRHRAPDRRSFARRWSRTMAEGGWSLPVLATSQWPTTIEIVGRPSPITPFVIPARANMAPMKMSVESIMAQGWRRGRPVDNVEVSNLGFGFPAGRRLACVSIWSICDCSFIPPGRIASRTAPSDPTLRWPPSERIRGLGDRGAPGSASRQRLRQRYSKRGEPSKDCNKD
jgi:hypothetical protein